MRRMSNHKALILFWYISWLNLRPCHTKLVLTTFSLRSSELLNTFQSCGCPSPFRKFVAIHSYYVSQTVRTQFEPIRKNVVWTSLVWSGVYFNHRQLVLIIPCTILIMLNVRFGRDKYTVFMSLVWLGLWSTRPARTGGISWIHSSIMSG